MALLVKPGVILGTVFAPAGARLLEVLKQLAPTYDFDLTITSFRDGVHSGPGDPHPLGEAVDLRVHGLTDDQVRRLLIDLRATLYRVPRRFYVTLEGAGTPDAHIHCQRRAGTQYSALDYLNNL